MTFEVIFKFFSTRHSQKVSPATDLISNLMFGLGDSVRVTPCGMMAVSMAILFAVYWTVGTEGPEVDTVHHQRDTHQVAVLLF